MRSAARFATVIFAAATPFVTTSSSSARAMRGMWIWTTARSTDACSRISSLTSSLSGGSADGIRDSIPAASSTDRALAISVASRTRSLEGVYPENPPSQRDQLLRALNEREWNVARVARDLGVTRRTVYLRMARFDIARQHIPKNVRVKRAI